jgi:hypothetical protein
LGEKYIREMPQCLTQTFERLAGLMLGEHALECPTGG